MRHVLQRGLSGRARPASSRPSGNACASIPASAGASPATTTARARPPRPRAPRASRIRRCAGPRRSPCAAPLRHAARTSPASTPAGAEMDAVVKHWPEAITGHGPRRRRLRRRQEPVEEPPPTVRLPRPNRLAGASFWAMVFLTVVTSGAAAVLGREPGSLPAPARVLVRQAPLPSMSIAMSPWATAFVMRSNPPPARPAPKRPAARKKRHFHH